MIAKIHVDPQATPKFCKARPVPYALRGKIYQELKRLEKNGIIKPVEFAECVAPIVPVFKPDRSVRICDDNKNHSKSGGKIGYVSPSSHRGYICIIGWKKTLQQVGFSSCAYLPASSVDRGITKIGHDQYT